MEKIIERIESIIDRQLALLESKPFSTSLKFLLFYWLFKKVYGHLKES